ncbi:MAG: nitrile hydratase subunit beta [Gammaproteobacteria bacterium]
MNGIHDLGGMDGMGAVVREKNEPVFHADWERSVFAHTLAMLAAGYFRTDEVRRAIELIPPAQYLESSYYERWLVGLTMLMLEKDVLTADELESGRSMRGDGGTALPPLPKEAAEFAMTNPMPANVDVDAPTRFAVGDAVITRNMNPTHHTRIPRYVRGKRGTIHEIQQVFLLPDTNAYGGPDTPERVYTVEFSARELWGGDAPARDSLYIDMFDSYLDPS